MLPLLPLLFIGGGAIAAGVAIARKKNPSADEMKDQLIETAKRSGNQGDAVAYKNLNEKQIKTMHNFVFNVKAKGLAVKDLPAQDRKVLNDVVQKMETVSQTQNTPPAAQEPRYNMIEVNKQRTELNNFYRSRMSYSTNKSMALNSLQPADVVLLHNYVFNFFKPNKVKDFSEQSKLQDLFTKYSILRP